jgi:8-amino-7-oxononanoate synthase
VFHVTHTAPRPLAHLHAALAALEAKGLRRVPPPPLDVDAVSFCSNDYLGLGGRFAPTATTGAGASRLIVERQALVDMEEAFARWLGVEACLAFTSGYAANVGALAALAAPDDLIVSDALNHASLIDGARLSRAHIVIVGHNDVDAVAKVLAERSQRRAWVVVESYYSMDADGPDLARLRHVCDTHDAALYVDEAHALGVLGPEGRGRLAEASVAPDVLVGTLGKAFGGQGAFVAGSRVLREWLWNRARSFVFSTGLAPMAADAARLALDEIIRTPHLREHVSGLTTRLRDGLTALDLRPMGFGHVVPILIGSSERAVMLSAALAEEGLSIPPIRPPTVPEGTSRLRLTVTARHGGADVDTAIDAFRRALERIR